MSNALDDFPFDEKHNRWPCDPGIEECVLGTCLNYPEAAVETLRLLTVDDFHIRANKVVFEAFQHLRDISFEIDRITLYETLLSRNQVDLVGGMSGIVDLDNNIPGGISGLESWCRILKKFTHLRALIVVGQQIVKQALELPADPRAIYDQLQDTLYDRFLPMRSDRLQSIAEFVDTFPGGINELLQPQRKSLGLLTGFEKFDAMTDGLHESEIFMIGGSPGSGKSGLMLGTVVNIAKRDSQVAVFSQEMSRQALFNRIVCSAARVSVNRFRRGDLTQEERLRVLQATDFAKKLPLHIDPTSGMRVPDLAMKLRQLDRRRPVKLCAIDYIQLMRSSSSKHTENDRLTEISQGIQEIAKTTGIPFLILCQLSRPDSKARSQRPGLHSLRGSGTIESVSNVVGLIYREDMYNKDRQDTSGVAELIIAKNREGEMGTIFGKFIAWRQIFEDL